MGEAKWTPGPWRLAGDGSPFVYCLNADGINRMAATVHSGWLDGGNRTDPEESVANSHLIAAAPDLYEALEAVMAHMRGEAGYSTAHHKARAALAKARGESDG